MHRLTLIWVQRKLLSCIWFSLCCYRETTQFKPEQKPKLLENTETSKSIISSVKHYRHRLIFNVLINIGFFPFLFIYYLLFFIYLFIILCACVFSWALSCIPYNIWEDGGDTLSCLKMFFVLKVTWWSRVFEKFWNLVTTSETYLISQA